MKKIILIPARMASQRLANKPLQDINGEPMVVHVWRRAMESNIGDVVVACDDEKVARAIQEQGGQAVLTNPDLPSGSDRIWQALQVVDSQGDYDFIVNLQGDLPNVPPRFLQKVLKPLQDETVDIGTLGVRFENEKDRQDPNQVKIVLSKEAGKTTGRALYFTRANAPYAAPDAYYHVGIYAYRRSALEKFINLPVSSLEAVERLEQLRALEAGMRIDVELVDQKPIGVDTLEDLEQVRHVMKIA